MIRKLLVGALALPLVAGCEAPTGPGGAAQVSVRFGTSGSASAAQYSQSGTGSMVVQGSNGVLTITSVRFIVSELELERLESECDNSGSGNQCDDYEAPISFVSLPLSGGAVTVATAAVDLGVYDELDFEVENLEADSTDDAAKRQAIANLLASIRGSAGLSDFPAQASMVVQGDFNGEPFKVYFDAEIEVELRFAAGLTVDQNGASAELTVDVKPDLWFRNADGTVEDLTAYDYAQTGAVVEFATEIARGFASVQLGG